MNIMPNQAPLRVAIAGLGTVGCGLIELLDTHGAEIARRCGRPITVTAVSARDRERNRPVDISSYDWYDDAMQMAAEADVDLVVELIGGSDGTAKGVCERALESGRHVVTANKALLAIHGTSLARTAETSGRALAYEAAVAGGIPIIKSLREGLLGNKVDRLHGILNGTCNFILSQMRETGASFAEVLDEAQQLGYAEADPTFDVDGIDAAHKLALLASLAFGTEVDFGNVHVEGIRRITPADLEFAGELGFKIKLLGIAERTEAGIVQRVHPTMVPVDSPIAAVEGVFNAVVCEGDFVGTSVLEGRGAGGGPTASAVVADIADIACGRMAPVFGVPASTLAAPNAVPMDRLVSEYYVRLRVIDQPGVIADVTAALRDEAVSLESIIQRGRNPDEPVDVVLTTHETEEAALMRALATIEALGAVKEAPNVIRIARFDGE